MDRHKEARVVKNRHIAIFGIVVGHTLDVGGQCLRSEEGSLAYTIIEGVGYKHRFENWNEPQRDEVLNNSVPERSSEHLSFARNLNDERSRLSWAVCSTDNLTPQV